MEQAQGMSQGQDTSASVSQPTTSSTPTSATYSKHLRHKQ